MEYEYERALTLATFYVRPDRDIADVSPTRKGPPKSEYPVFQRPKRRRDKGYRDNRLQSWVERRPYAGHEDGDDRIGLLTDYDMPLGNWSAESLSSILGPDLTLAMDKKIVELDCQEISEPSFAALAPSLIASLVRSEKCGTSFVVLATSVSSDRESSIKKADRLKNLLDALQGKTPDPPPTYRQAVQAKQEDAYLAALEREMPILPFLQDDPEYKPKRRRGAKRQRLARELREAMDFKMRPLTWADVKADARRYVAL